MRFSDALERWASELNRSPEWKPVRVHCFVAALLLLTDSFVTMMGLTAMFTLVSVAIGIPLVGVHLIRKRWTKASVRAAVVGVYVSALIMAVVVLTIQNRIARARAEIIVEAGKAYHQRHGEYPPALDALVPDFLDSVPKAKLVLVGGRFTYQAGPDGKHVLLWREVGYLRSVYEFESDSWSKLD